MPSHPFAFRVVFFAALSATALVLLNRCGMEQSQAPSGTFRSVFQAIQSNNCAECHTATGSAWINDNVQLEFANSASAYTGLTTKTVMGASSVGICAGIKQVKPNSLAQSYLAGVLFADVHKNDFAGVVGCTPYATHLTDVNLSAAQVTSIKAWINNGAPND